jgi:uncharacterized membrane protein SirB2
MPTYLLLESAHIALALISGLGFALRGFVILVLGRPIGNRFVRVAPHVLDTLLLASGVTLWILIGWPLISWLGLKLVLVLAYILLGIAAFRTRRRHRGVLLYLAALLSFLVIAAIALYKPV